MQVLRWWFGPSIADLPFGDDGFEYSESAWVVNDDSSVPGAVYEIWRDGDVITVVRTVLVDLARDADGRPLLKRPAAATWAEWEKRRPT